MVMVMGDCGEGGQPPPRRGGDSGGNGDDAMVMVMEMEEVILLHPLIQDNHGTTDTEEIDGST